MATHDEIKESELGNKAKILGYCLRRSPSTDVWSADYGRLLVYETPDRSGEFHRFENLDRYPLEARTCFCQSGFKESEPLEERRTAPLWLPK